jgi:hypothetical protein
MSRDVVVLGFGFGDWYKLGDFKSRESVILRSWAALYLCADLLRAHSRQDRPRLRSRSCASAIRSVPLDAGSPAAQADPISSSPLLHLVRSSRSVLIIGTCQIILATRSYLFCRSLAMGTRLSWVELGGSALKAILILGSVACGIGSLISMTKYPHLFALGMDNQKALMFKKA